MAPFRVLRIVLSGASGSRNHRKIMVFGCLDPAGFFAKKSETTVVGSFVAGEKWHQWDLIRVLRIALSEAAESQAGEIRPQNDDFSLPSLIVHLRKGMSA